MNGKFTKYLAYAFFIGVILLIVLGSADSSQSWVLIVRLIAFILVMIAGLFYVGIIIYCIIDNKKIDKYLTDDNYDALIEYSTKKVNKKSIILDGRKKYYEYLLLLSYLAKDESVLIDEYFEKLKGQELMFPMISYWKVCYKFSLGQYDELKTNFNDFKNSREVMKAPYKYANLTNLLYVFILFSENKIKEAKNELRKLDTSSISMPSTIKSIKIVEEAEVMENEEVINVETIEKTNENTVE